MNKSIVDTDLLITLTTQELHGKYPDISPLRLARMKLEARIKLGLWPEPINLPIIDGDLLLGLTLVEAKNKHPRICIRPVKIDGKSQGVYYNIENFRHNVEIENNIITKFRGLY